MNRFRKLVPALAIAAIALGAIGGTAIAGGPGGGYGGGYGGGGGSLPGVLEAQGDGIAAASGRLIMEICATDGVLLVKGGVEIPDDAFEDEVSWLGLHVYFGFTGCATIGGEGEGTSAAGRAANRRSIAALGVGEGLEVRAAGNGIAFLKGEGTWEKDTSESGEWTEDGVIVKIGGTSKCGGLEAMHSGGGEKKGKKCPTVTPEPTEEPTEEPTAEPTEEPTEEP